MKTYFNIVQRRIGGGQPRFTVFGFGLKETGIQTYDQATWLASWMNKAYEVGYAEGEKSQLLPGVDIKREA